MLIIGLCGVLAMGVAVVTDASAAYLQRQGLDSLADGAALAGADLGAAGDDVYTGGLGDDRLAITEAEARAAVAAYLAARRRARPIPGPQGDGQRRPRVPDHPRAPDRPAPTSAHRAGRSRVRADRRDRRGRGGSGSVMPGWVDVVMMYG